MLVVSLSLSLSIFLYLLTYIRVSLSLISGPLHLTFLLHFHSFFLPFNIFSSSRLTFALSVYLPPFWVTKVLSIGFPRTYFLTLSQSDLHSLSPDNSQKRSLLLSPCSLPLNCIRKWIPKTWFVTEGGIFKSRSLWVRSHFFLEFEVLGRQYNRLICSCLGPKA